MSKEELHVTDLNEIDETETLEEVAENTGEENKNKKKKFNIVNALLILIGVVCIGVSVYSLYGIYTEYKNAVDKYDSLEEEFVTIHIPSSEDDDTTETEAPQVPWYELASVDLEGLQKKYPDIIGWMFFEDGLISYPVLQADDNEKYLYNTYDGKESSSGSIFMEATDSSDFSDTHTIIYGHNMKNLSMFGRLKHYKTQSGYYDSHMYFQIFRGNEILRYQIFAYQEVPVDSFVYQESFTSARVLANRLLANSMVNPGLEIDDSDKIITLSTCTADDEHRFVVSAVLVERYSLIDKALIED